MSRGDLRDAILSAVKADPSARNVEIAKRTGATQAYVSVVRQRHGALRGKVIPVKASLAPENSKWLDMECERLGVSESDLVNALITDARNEGIQ